MEKSQSYNTIIKNALSGKFTVQKFQKQSFAGLANNIAVIAQYRNAINKNLQLIKKKVLNLHKKIDQASAKKQLKQIDIYLSNAIRLNAYQNQNNSLIKFLENQIMAKISTFLDLIEEKLPVTNFFYHEQNEQLKSILQRIFKCMSCTTCYKKQNLNEYLVEFEEKHKSQNLTENNKHQDPTDEQFQQKLIVDRIMSNIHGKYPLNITQIEKESLIEHLIKLQKYYSLLLPPLSSTNIESLHNYEQQIQKKNEEIQQMKNQKQQQIKQIQNKCQEQLDKLQTQIKHMKKQNQQLRAEQKRQQQQSTCLNKQLVQIKQQSAKTSQQYDTFKNTTSKLQNQLNNFQQKIQQLETRLIQQRTKMTGYSSGILYPYLHLAKFLQSSLEQEMKTNIQRAQLVYKKDPLNPTNMMLYFPGRTNLLLIVQTTNDHFIACFTEAGPENNSIKQHKKGLIMSLTNNKVFGLNYENPSLRPVTFEDYYLIFGNSQFRIKSGQQHVFSNLGILNKFYQNNEYTVDVLFGQGSKRQVELKNYQVYQLTFSK